MQYAYSSSAQLKEKQENIIEQYREWVENTELHLLFPAAKYAETKHSKNLTASHQHALVCEENLTLAAPVCLSKCQEDYTANTGIIISFLVY